MHVFPKIKHVSPKTLSVLFGKEAMHQEFYTNETVTKYIYITRCKHCCN